MEANVKETRADWPADGMATLIFPNGLRKIYRKLKDPKEQDAVMSWLGRYILTGEDRENYKVQEYLKILLKDEVSRIFRKQKANTENGRRGGSQTQANRKRTPSEAEANAKRMESEAEANEERASSKIKGKGKDKVGGKPPTTPAKENLARTDAREEAPPAELELRGYEQFAAIVPRLEAVGLPNGVRLVDLFSKAEAFRLTPDDVVEFASHYAGRGWEFPTDVGRKPQKIDSHTLAGAMSKWSLNKPNYERGGSNGSNGNRNHYRGNGPRTDAAAYVDDPFS